MPKKTPQKHNSKELASQKTNSESKIIKILGYTRYPRYLAYIIGLIFVLLIYTNTPFPLLNPQTEPMPYNWIITYPSSSPNQIDVNENMAILIANISAPQGFVDGYPIVIHAYAGVGGNLVNDIKEIWVGFYGAYWYPLTVNGFQPSPFGAVELTSIGNENNGQVWFAPEGDQTAHFVGDDREVAVRSAGNYPLSIVIEYNNGSSPTKYTYDDLTINVQSSLDIQTSKQSTMFLALEAVTFFFAVLDLLPRLAPKIVKNL